MDQQLMWCSQKNRLSFGAFFAGLEAPEALADAAGEAGEAGEAGGSLPSSAPSKLNAMRP